MKPITHLTLIGTYAPRQCGIATFTQDLRNAMLAARPTLRASVAMITEEPCTTRAPSEVQHIVVEQNRAAYRVLRDELNDSGTDAVSLQHEYGIFGGPDGAWILDTLRGLRPALITTFHTVLAAPSSGQRQVLCEIARLSAAIIVMSTRGRDLLAEVYDVPLAKISVVPHGIPDMDPATIDREAWRDELGWTGRKVILTTGLLSPNKGLHDVIKALPRIVAQHPDALYVVAGATHPNLVRSQGETCRHALMELATSLGVNEHVRFINRFASREELVSMIVASDLFVTPYLSEAQITSGVLAYASGLGKPVISTPYWHARELLDEHIGALVPFASPDAIADIAIDLFNDAERLHHMTDAAYRNGRSSTWSQIGKRYLNVIDTAASSRMDTLDQPTHVSLDHLHHLMGPLGLFQHAKYNEPDFEHGYCTDDNARALIAIIDLQRCGHPDPRLEQLKQRCFAFLLDAFDVTSGRFRNLRSTDDEWHDGPHSEDSHGRALWALGHAARYVEECTLRRESISLFVRGLPAVTQFTSPRAWAFTLLGLGKLSEVSGGAEIITEMQMKLARRLLRLHEQSPSEGWSWFEDSLTYDNARLPQALLVTAAQLEDPAMRHVGLASLNWLMRQQQTPDSHFRPIGCERPYQRGDEAPPQWDQQPLEAYASVAACLAAHRISGSRRWFALARNSFAWFEGHNDLGLPVADFGTGACFDGMHPDRLNQNCGAESTLAFLQACAELRLHPVAPAEPHKALTAESASR